MNIDASAVIRISRVSIGTVVSSSIHIGTSRGYGVVGISVN
jgi:hypothetical protein